MNYQPTVDSDLQKAIDDITKTTETDPIFADPVAAPADAAAVAAPTFGDTTYATEMPAMPAAPAMPEPAMPPMPASPMMPPMPEPVAAAPAAPEAPVIPELPELPTIEAPEAPVVEAPATPAEEPKVKTPEAPAMPFLDTESLNKDQVKEAALRSLAPIADKLDISASRKFEIYKNVIDNYNDTSVLESAYHAATEIEDESERGDALLYLIDSIDNM